MIVKYVIEQAASGGRGRGDSPRPPSVPPCVHPSPAGRRGGSGREGIRLSSLLPPLSFVIEMSDASGWSADDPGNGPLRLLDPLGVVKLADLQSGWERHNRASEEMVRKAAREATEAARNATAKAVGAYSEFLNSEQGQALVDAIAHELEKGVLAPVMADIRSAVRLEARTLIRMELPYLVLCGSAGLVTAHVAAECLMRWSRRVEASAAHDPPDRRPPFRTRAKRRLAKLTEWTANRMTDTPPMLRFLAWAGIGFIYL